MLSVASRSILFAILFLEYKAEAVSQGTLRFFMNNNADNEQAWSSGIVEIYYSGSWGNICDDNSFGLDEASVICHQLSYSGASTYTNTGSSSLYGNDTKSTALEDVSCFTISSFLSITQCSFKSAYSTYCASNTRDVIVSCYTTRIWNYPTTGNIRLVSGNYSNQGLLEVYCNGEWGTVCSKGFGSTEASVACIQLGYNDYYDYDHLSLKVTPPRNIWLSDFTDYCSSSYSTCLTECEWCPISRVTSCSHSQDMTLECEYSSSDDDVYTDTSNICDFEDYDYGIPSLILICSIVGSIVFLIICALIIGVPICICCCLGIGIGAAGSRSRPRSVIINQPVCTETTAIIATSQQQQHKPDEQTKYYPPPPPPPYSYQSTHVSTGYTKLQEEYPPQC